MKIPSWKKSITYRGIRFHRYPDGYWIGGHPQRKLHRFIWETQVGPIPPGHVIHHRNEDTNDNRVENLECITPSQHNARHRRRDMENLAKAQEAATRIARTPERRQEFAARVRSMWRTRKARPIQCQRCGKIRLTKSMNRVQYCSRTCKDRHRYEQ